MLLVLHGEAAVMLDSAKVSCLQCFRVFFCFLAGDGVAAEGGGVGVSALVEVKDEKVVSVYYMAEEEE